MLVAEHGQVGRFELVARIASGGMGTVSLARLRGAHGFQRMVAIKRLHEHLRDDADLVRMFLDEARLAARIHHPHVVPIVEVGEDAGGLYLVMEFVDGPSAADLSAATDCLPRPVALRIVLDALAGLAAAHALLDDDGKPLDIIHRDVSPQNILVGVDGLSRLTDFGIARAASRLHQTRGNEIKGKMGYMAPEQVSSRPLDRRVDVFAMGVVLWELLTGRLLFRADNDAETVNRLLYLPVPRVREVAPDVPQALDDVCAKALARAPDERFPSATAFLDALEQAIERGGAASHREVGTCVERLLGQSLDVTRASMRKLTLASAAPAKPETDVLPKSLAPGDLAAASTERAVMSRSANELRDTVAEPNRHVAAARARRGVPRAAWIVALAVVGVGAAAFTATRFRGTHAQPPQAVVSAPPPIDDAPPASEPDPGPVAQPAQTGTTPQPADPAPPRRRKAPSPRAAQAASSPPPPASAPPAGTLNRQFGERL